MTDGLQEIKEEIGRVVTRLDNVEGYFDNFNTTLENHMTDYERKQDDIARELSSVKGRFGWGFWVLFGLMTVALTGLVGTSVVLIQHYLRTAGQIITGG